MEFLIFLAILAALAFWVVAIYNKLVTLKNRYENAFAQIEVQLKRRYDLIPNLVETAKGYLEHERGTLEAVTNARNTAMAGLAAASKAPGSVDAMAERRTHQHRKQGRIRAPVVQRSGNRIQHLQAVFPTRCVCRHVWPHGRCRTS